MLLRSRYWIWAAAILLTFVKLAHGQGETTSAIVGSVVDPTGAAISGAIVTVTNVENGLKRSVKTDDSGRFSFPQLKPGIYSVKAETVLNHNRTTPCPRSLAKGKPSISG
jgi:hypothetical protein